MNGYLTERESRHLTPQEYEHYFGLGLCAPPTAAVLAAFMAADQKELEYAVHQRDELNETVADIQNTLEGAYVALGVARGGLEKATQELEACRREISRLKDEKEALEYHLRAYTRTQTAT